MYMDYHIILYVWASLVAQMVKASAFTGSIPGSGSSPGEGNGNPLQYSCLENPMDGRTWWATVHGVAKSRTRLSELTSLHYPQENSGPERTTGKQVQACCVSRNCRKVSVIE